MDGVSRRLSCPVRLPRQNMGVVSNFLSQISLFGQTHDLFYLIILSFDGGDCYADVDQIASGDQHSLVEFDLRHPCKTMMTTVAPMMVKLTPN